MVSKKLLRELIDEVKWKQMKKVLETPDFEKLLAGNIFIGPNYDKKVEELSTKVHDILFGNDLSNVLGDIQKLAGKNKDVASIYLFDSDKNAYDIKSVTSGNLECMHYIMVAGFPYNAIMKAKKIEMKLGDDNTPIQNITSTLNTEIPVYVSSFRRDRK